MLGVLPLLFGGWVVLWKRTSQYFYLIIHFSGLFSKKITSFIRISVQYPFTFYLHFNILMSSFLHFVLCFKSTSCWLCWVFVVVHGLSLAAVSLGCSLVAPRRIPTVSGFSCCGAPALGQVSSVVVEHGLSCPVACGIFLDQGSHLCPLQVDSEPLDHHGSPSLCSSCWFFFFLNSLLRTLFYWPFQRSSFR